MSNDPLHDFVHKALAELPEHRAPGTLIDRVNAAVVARAMHEALPWYARGWTVWPASLRALVVVAGVGAVAAFVWLGFAGVEWFGAAPVREIAVERAPVVSSLISAFVAVIEVLWLAVERIAQPYLLLLLIVMGAAYAGCIGLGAGVYRFLHTHRQ